jgi:diguanylate cyclase (GGDEF)-like protein
MNSRVLAWQRLHSALMPDYNRKAAAYWWCLVVLGALALSHAVQGVAAMSAGHIAQVLACAAVAAVAGAFPLRIPGSKNSFAAGEIFIFLLLCLHGPAAATLASTGEAVVGSWRASKRWTSRLAYPAMAAVSMLCTGHLFDAALSALRGANALGAPALLLAAIVLALAYFMVNTLLVALMPALKRDELPTLADLFGDFGWASISYAGSASVATLLYLASQHSGLTVLLAAVPIIALLLATMHLFFRQQEADETARKARLEAVEREQQQAQRHMGELQHIAFHDSLTGLPNRHRFYELLARAMDRVRADQRQQFGVMFLDFDRFKLINDSLGHSMGDDFLVQLARRIQEHVRPSDMVARLGGDEFAVLLEGAGCEGYAIALAERLLHALSQPLRIGGTEVHTSASIGITTSAFGYSEPGEVLRDADIAMYRAKHAGKARYALFDVGLRAEVATRMRLEGELRRALDAGQITVEYQPLFRLASGTLTGFEALARWHHHTLGTVPPVSFIPIAEESGLIVPLSDMVLRQACQQLRRWQECHPVFADLTMQINISGNDLAHSGFVGRVTHALMEARMQPQYLTLELTENILMARLEGALPMLDELRALGVRLSVDDFGTGYSSLAHLSSLPIDCLKIDKSFVRDLAPGSKSSSVVDAIIHLAHALDKTVLAEGIETMTQLTELRTAGCDQGQGFYMSPSLLAHSVDLLLTGIAAGGLMAVPQFALGNPELRH